MNQTNFWEEIYCRDLWLLENDVCKILNVLEKDKEYRVGNLKTSEIYSRTKTEILQGNLLQRPISIGGVDDFCLKYNLDIVLRIINGKIVAYFDDISTQCNIFSNTLKDIIQEINNHLKYLWGLYVDTTDSLKRNGTIIRDQLTNLLSPRT